MRKSVLIAAGALLLLVAACKPTENNYRQAYELASQRKAEAESEIDAELNRRINAENRLPMMAVGADSVPYRHEPLTVAPGEGEPQLHRYNLAVALYAMRTNARSHTERLKASGLDAYMAQNAKGEFYVMAAGGEDADALAGALRKWRNTNKNSNSNFPILIIRTNP